MNLWQELSARAATFFDAPALRLGGKTISTGTLLQLVLYFAILAIAARAFKQLLRDRLLLPLRLDETNRGAIATLVSYSLAAGVGLILLQSAGLNLSSLAVPAGALGVGIGLGLQNITKNFVSGLSLLLERKLRVGDFVEFGDRAGHIVEVSLRAAIIRTLDGANVLVPNSELVEQQVVNWHYDSPAARLHVPVGVAYGSDPLLVTETLLNAAYAEPAVRHDPPPTVIFTGFGDSALNFTLRVWVDGFEREPDIRSALNFNIEYHLRQRGVAIPFPQRDLWLRNPETLAESWRSRDRAERDGNGSAPAIAEVAGTATVQALSLPETLRQVDYFEAFSDLELRRLIECGYRRHLASGEVLFREGEPGNAFYIVLSGVVEAVAEKLDKQLAILGTGQFFGELSLMLGIPRTASVRALEDSVLFAINRKGFTKLLRDYPHVSEAIVESFSKHQTELAERQKQLRALGLVDAAEDDKNPMVWLRKRLKNLFNA